MRVILFVACLLYALPACMGYINPVQGEHDSPDPGVVHDGQFYYATTTMGWGGHYFPIWRSKTLFNWTQEGWGLMSRPSWTKCCDFWAPEIHIINHEYKLYYTARDSNGKLCIGVAHSEKPTGPYIDRESPLLCNATQGVIDATVFNTGNELYLIYKTDGNAHGKPTEIYAIRLTSDGMSVNGQHYLLIRDSLAWERGIVEAPWIVFNSNTLYYYLFYSSCGYANKCYSIGVARAKNLLGAYEKHPTPILFTNPNETSKSWEGPGHCSVLKTQTGKWAVVYHAWPHAQIDTKRVMLVDELKWVNNWPQINNGSPSEKELPDF